MHQQTLLYDFSIVRHHNKKTHIHTFPHSQTYISINRDSDKWIEETKVDLQSVIFSRPTASSGIIKKTLGDKTLIMRSGSWSGNSSGVLYSIIQIYFAENCFTYCLKITNVTAVLFSKHLQYSKL